MSRSRFALVARSVLVAVYTLASFGFSSVAKADPTVLPGYSFTQIHSGLNLPTNLAWLPDGTMLVVEKAGVVKTSKNGVLGTTPMIDITSSTNDYWDRGLLGIAVDPDYNNNHYIYAMRTFENNPSDYTGTKENQLIRVTINPTTNQMVAGSLTVLVGTQTPATCQNLPATADCIPSDSPSHSVGDVVFAADGTIFFTSGDGSSFDYTDVLALRAQNLDNLNGKMLHVDRNGKGLTTNPFYTGNVNDNKSKVWAYGLRNPWRFAIKPGTNTPYITDVGYTTWEEVDVAQAGRNFGWPCYEGAGKQPDYATLDGCKTLYSQVSAGTATVTAPLISTNHNGNQSAIAGGAWVTGSTYPSDLQGSFMFGDYALNYLKTLRTDSNNVLTSGPTTFADNFGAPVDIEQGPDGKIYVLSISDAAGDLNTGQLFRLDYQTPPPPGQCPAGQFDAQYFNTVNLSGTAALEQCENAPISHNWGLGSPANGVNADNFSARYSGTFNFNAGTYNFTASADDGVRLLVDGQTVVDGWKDQAYTTYNGSANLTAGAHTVTVEYYDSGDDAALDVTWSQGGGNGACANGQFNAQYYNSLTPGSVAAALTQCENAPISHNWGMGSPAAGVNADNFSARYTGTFAFNAADYTFTTSADDGTRILVDGQTVVDGWKDQETTAYSATKTMTAGNHTVVVEYYDSGYDANLTASWSQMGGSTTCTDGQFKAEYFNSLTPGATTAVVTQCENAPISHNWGMGSPAAGVNADNFSARYTGTFAFAAGNYTFTTSADDGTRILVDGQTVVDGWKDQETTAYSATKAMTAGNHTVVVEYYDSGYDANLTASWSQVVNQLPTATIASPANGKLFAVGATVNLSGSAVDPEDGNLPAANLSWNVVVKHCPDGSACHNHFLQSLTGSTASFVFPDHGTDPYYVEVTLTATDSQGGTGSKVIALYPDRAASCATGRIAVSYFNNKTLSGTPAATDCTDAINYDWGLGAPMPGVNVDNFSARYTTTQTFAAGTYKFSLTGDDGIRLYVDGTLLINGWKDQGATTYTKNKALTAGNHTIKVEYYDSGENAVAKASWVKQ